MSTPKVKGCFSAAMGISAKDAKRLGDMADAYSTGDTHADYASAIGDLITEITSHRDLIHSAVTAKLSETQKAPSNEKAPEAVETKTEQPAAEVAPLSLSKPENNDSAKPDSGLKLLNQEQKNNENDTNTPIKTHDESIDFGGITPEMSKAMSKRNGNGLDAEDVPGGSIEIKRGDMKTAIQKQSEPHQGGKMNRLDKPFTVRIAAQKAAKEAGDGFAAVPAPGGFVVKKLASSDVPVTMTSVVNSKAQKDAAPTRSEKPSSKATDAVASVDSEALTDDILHPKTRKPFTARLPAEKVAKLAGDGHRAVKVKGGWVARKAATATA